VIRLKCLENDPRRRCASAEALAEALGHWLAVEPITARLVGQAVPIGAGWTGESLPSPHTREALQRATWDDGLGHCDPTGA
jgi:hypothetical protein